MPPKKQRKTKTASGKEVVENHLVKALSHPVRARALAIFNDRVASPKEIADELGLEIGNVSYHVKTLKDLGCVQLVKTRQVRGATEHFYRGVTRSFLNDEGWAQLSEEARKGISVVGLKMIDASSMEALLAGTFDARPDRHLSRSPVNVDELGWDELTDLLANTLEGVFEIQARSASRLAGTQDKSIRATVSILGFESPPSEGKREQS